MNIFLAMRGLIGADQSTVATGAGVSMSTYVNAEQGKACTDKTRAAVLSYFAVQGCQLAPLPGGVVAIAWIDKDDRHLAIDWIAPQSIATTAKRGKAGVRKTRVLSPDGETT